MTELSVSTDSLNNARSFLIQFLKDAGFTGSTEAGTAIHDIVIKPMALLYTIFSDAVTRAKAYNSLSYAESVKELLGSEEYSAAVDSILGNWFVYRKDGVPSSGTIRLFFSKPLDFLDIQPGGAKFVINSKSLDVSRRYTVSPSSFKSIYNTDRYSVEYYFDVEVQTLDNIEITSEDLAGGVIAAVGSVYFLRATVVGDFIQGETQESDAAFITRTHNVIATRELITIGAVSTVLPDTFSGVNSVYVAGFNDPEQIRDIVPHEGSTLHIGNKADIYVATSMVKSLVLCDLTGSGGDEVDTTLLGSHISDVIAVRDPYTLQGNLLLHVSTIPSSLVIPAATVFTSDGGVEVHTDAQITLTTSSFTPFVLPNDYGGYALLPVVTTQVLEADLEDPTELSILKGTVFTTEATIAGSVSAVADEDFTHQEIFFSVTTDGSSLDLGTVGIYPTITADSDYPLQSKVYLEFLGGTLYSDVLAYVTDSTHRVVCYDPVIKSKYPIIFSFDIEVDAVSTDIDAVKAQCKSVIVSYVNSISGTDTFSVYDLIGYMNNHASLVTQVRLPLGITYAFRDPDTLMIGTGVVSNEFFLSDMVSGLSITSPMVTENTVQWYTSTEFVSVSVVSIRV